MIGIHIGGAIDHVRLSRIISKINETGYSAENHLEEVQFFQRHFPHRHKHEDIFFMCEESLFRLRMYQDFRFQTASDIVGE